MGDRHIDQRFSDIACVLQGFRYHPALDRDGEIGRRGGLKIRWAKHPWGFESPSRYERPFGPGSLASLAFGCWISNRSAGGLAVGPEGFGPAHTASGAPSVVRCPAPLLCPHAQNRASIVRPQ